MNQIKIKDWCKNVGILFEPYALDIYIQNDGVKRFSCLIIEKVWIIRLFTNLLYKLWEEIIAAAIYLYNQTFCASNN